MMNHRRDDHPEVNTKCRFYLKGICVYEDAKCWYKHKESFEETQVQDKSEDFKCNFCEEIFTSKSAMLKHRKLHTEAAMFKCRDFKQGYCRFTSNECWYEHEKMNTNEEKEEEEVDESSVFQKARPNPNPPDMMERMMTMVEKLMMKVENLERVVHREM